ncbi:PREDICTED: protein GPR107 [Nicrophorus vespilloides]|uniref:Protein GPR107 n=1 Tax=Nicrophorus vespilloides TaxID=110193 RepID=A0ABM1MKS1_NICVS|nr:PREDICTED: protein GPR107 [Nicrophorus vespilloides]
MTNFTKYLLLMVLIPYCASRKHTLEISNDERRYIALSTFGFYKGGVLEVQLENFRASSENASDLFGFSIDRTLNDAMNPYLDTHTEKCLLQEMFSSRNEHFSAAIYFSMDLKNSVMKVNCSQEWKDPLHIYKNSKDMPVSNNNILDEENFKRLKRQTTVQQNTQDQCTKLKLPITKRVVDGITYYNTSFVIAVASVSEEGLYNLYFHSCPNYDSNSHKVYDFTMHIREQNEGGYLSAGEMPLPALYCTMAVLFFLSGCFWVFLLKQSRHPIFKLHYLMAMLVFLKALSLGFHGVNYHFIETLGVHLATWAILFYIAHLLKGALLFITLVLVGTGWTFIKHVLAPRDKRLFMAIIPLQVLANVAEIILEESEEGSLEHNMWRDVLIFVDLICCGCILFPVVWSIRHLQEASRTDGKVQIVLRKLKLFRHFYIMIVCYIYFTRIIVYLLKITVPFQYGWLDEMFREMATYVFFVMTGYKFRPAAHNPYNTVPTDDEEEEDLIISKHHEITKLKHTATITEVTEEESDSLLNQKESSHEYD